MIFVDDFQLQLPRRDSHSILIKLYVLPCSILCYVLLVLIHSRIQLENRMSS
jgi:hypothetical protein